MKKFILLLTIFIVFKSNAQNNNIHLKKVFCDSQIIIQDIIQQVDGSFLAIGGNGITDFQGCILKLDENYQLKWIKSYGGSYDDYFKFIRKINNNRYLLVGEATSIDGDLAAYSPPFSTANNIWMMIIDSSGNFIRGNTYGYGSSTAVQSVEVKNENNIFISGTTVAEYGDFVGNPGDPLTSQTYIALTDTLLSKKWLRYIAGLSSDDNTASKATLDTHGNLIIPIVSASISGDYAGLGPTGGIPEIYLFCVDTNQNILWRKKYVSSGADIITNIQSDAENNLFLTVNTRSIDGDFFTNEVKWSSIIGGYSYCTLAKADSVGNIIWKHAYGSFDTTMLELRNMDPVDLLLQDKKIWIYCTIQGRDSLGEGYGWTNQQGCVDNWIIQTDSNGILQNKMRFGGLRSEKAELVFYNEQKQIPVICDNTYGTGIAAVDDCVGIKNLDCKLYELEQWPVQITEPKTLPNFNWVISPNPSQEEIQIDFEKEFSGSLKIYNSTGNIIRTYKLNGAISTMIEVSTLVNGIYTIRLINADGSFQKQLVVYH